MSRLLPLLFALWLSGCGRVGVEPLTLSDLTGDGGLTPVPSSDGGCDESAGTCDRDGDGLPDGTDPCPDSALNDMDGDGVCDPRACMALPDDADTDADGAPDVCDACPADARNDADGDGRCAE